MGKSLAKAMASNSAGLGKYLTGKLPEFLQVDYGRGLNPENNPLVKYFQRIFGIAEFDESPLVIDLDGNGVETLARGSVYFDHNNDGFAEDTGWSSPNDGILVLDKNNNGIIENGNELFGNNTYLVSGKTADNGFSALAEYDSNHDKVINEQDAVFSILQVWKDINSDGKVDLGELHFLDSVNIKDIGLAYKPQYGSTAIDSHGNSHQQVGTYIDKAGNLKAISDVWFSINPSDTQEINNVDSPVTSEIAILPNLVGMGISRSLHQAMALDASGVIKQLVIAKINTRKSE